MNVILEKIVASMFGQEVANQLPQIIKTTQTLSNKGTAGLSEALQLSGDKQGAINFINGLAKNDMVKSIAQKNGFDVNDILGKISKLNNPTNNNIGNTNSSVNLEALRKKHTK